LPYDKNKVNCSTQYFNIKLNSCRLLPDKLNLEINADDKVILVFARVLAVQAIINLIVV
jgi:hypothetical protein